MYRHNGLMRMLTQWDLYSQQRDLNEMLSFGCHVALFWEIIRVEMLALVESSKVMTHCMYVSGALC